MPTKSAGSRRKGTTGEFQMDSLFEIYTTHNVSLNSNVSILADILNQHPAHGAQILLLVWLLFGNI